MYKFEKLTVWHEAIKLIELSYKLCSELPSFERNGLSDQLRRASTSIALNIAEGSGSDSDIEFKRYLLVSRKSFYEVIAILNL